MKKIELLDNNFDNNTISLYNLSIQIELDGFSFCITDTVRNKVVAFEHQEISSIISEDELVLKIEEIISHNNILKYKFENVKCLYVTNKSTIIPNEIYSDRQIRTYLNLNFEIDDNQNILSNNIKEIDSVNLFALPSKIEKVIVKFFPNVLFFHQASTFIPQCLNDFNTKYNYGIYANINSNFFDVCLLNDNKLQLYNSFYFNNDQDIVYYIMYIYKQFNLDVNKGFISLLGNIDEKSIIINLLKKYVREVKIASIASNDKLLDKLPTPNFNNILTLHKCE